MPHLSSGRFFCLAPSSVFLFRPVHGYSLKACVESKAKLPISEWKTAPEEELPRLLSIAAKHADEVKEKALLMKRISQFNLSHRRQHRMLLHRLSRRNAAGERMTPAELRQQLQRFRVGVIGKW